MTMFLLTLTGILSIVLIVRAVYEANVLLFTFAVFSFVTTILLTNGVAP